MTLTGLAFFVFSGVLLLSAVGVVAARNPVHAVLFLITCFFNTAGLFMLMGAEFLAMILVIVYVGAVAVLFLFVVMMLDIDFVSMREGFLRYLPLGGVLGLVLLVELILAITAEAGAGVGALAGDAPSGSAAALGAVLYTRYAYFFQLAGLILLTAMIGAIVLTLRTRTGIKRQHAGTQIARRAQDTIEIRTDIKPGQGI